MNSAIPNRVVEDAAGGGHGPRFCVDAPPARIELQTLFPALLSRFPDAATGGSD